MRFVVVLSLLLFSAGFVRGAEPTDEPGPPADAVPVKRTAIPPKDADLDLFLLVGQSNMAGRGKVERQDETPDPHVWTLARDDAWAPAIDPLHWDKKNAGVGLGKTFGMKIAKAMPGHHIGLVPCAVGGVSIDQWKKGGKLYDEALRRAKIAARHGHWKGILWHQGESDTKPPRIAAYPAKMDQLIADFRADLNAPDAPVIVGQLGDFDGSDPKLAPRREFNKMLAAFAGDRPGVGLATSEGFKSVGDNTHFDAASQREFGRRYAAVYLKLIKADSAKSTHAKTPDKNRPVQKD